MSKSSRPEDNGQVMHGDGSGDHAEASGSRLEADLICRPRTANGDIVARRIAYSHPLTGGTDLHKMELQKFLEEVEATDPLLAKYLRSVQQDRIRPQFRRVQDVRIQEDSNLAALRDRALAVDARVDSAVTIFRTERDRAIEPYLELADAAVISLSEAHKRAGELFGEVGASYDPYNHCEDNVIQVTRLSDREVASTLRLPFGEGINHAFLPKWLSWVGTTFCGSAFGISLGLASGMLQSQDILIQTKTGPVLTLAGIGIGLAALGRGWLRLAWHQFAESHWIGLTRPRQWAWFLSAMLSTIVASGIVISTDRQGILKAALVGSAWDSKGVGTSEVVFWIIAAAASMFYIGYSVFEGLAQGRQDGVRGLVAAFVDADFRVRVAARRADRDVKNALGGLNNVTSAVYRRTQALSLVHDVSLPFDELISRAEAERIPYPLDHSEEMKQRIQDALHNLEGIQIEFDALVSDFLAGRISKTPTGYLK